MKHYVVHAVQGDIEYIITLYSKKDLEAEIRYLSGALLKQEQKDILKHIDARASWYIENHHVGAPSEFVHVYVCNCAEPWRHNDYQK